MEYKIKMPNASFISQFWLFLTTQNSDFTCCNSAIRTVFSEFWVYISQLCFCVCLFGWFFFFCHGIKSKQDDVVQCSLFLRIASLYLCFLHLYHAAFTSCHSDCFFSENADFISNNSSQFCVHVFHINLYPTILMHNCKKKRNMRKSHNYLIFLSANRNKSSYRHFTF